MERIEAKELIGQGEARVMGLVRKWVLDARRRGWLAGCVCLEGCPHQPFDPRTERCGRCHSRVAWRQRHPGAPTEWLR